MSRLDPIDRQLLDFLCACVHHRCRVRTIKAARRAALRRLRYAGLVGFEDFTPSVSALRHWQERHVSPPSPGGAAGEEPPFATAADEGGGAAAARDSRKAVVEAAPPRLTGAQLYTEMMAEAARRGMHQTAVSKEVFGNQVQMSVMKSSARTVWAKTFAKAQAWLAGEPTSASSVTNDTPPTFGCGHPKTPENSQAVGRHRSPTCETCRAEKRHARRKAEPRPFDIQQPAHYRQADRAERVNARRGAAIRRSIEQRALALVDGDQSVKSAGGQVNQVMAAAVNEIRARRAAEARQTDPVERAKLALQRRYAPVCSMAVYGGESDLFMVGNRKNVTQAELLQMAGRIAA